jgi:hypothetical protein
MGESEGVIRVNVSVPKKLKERMDAEKGAANWSAVATEAFEAKLLELASQREATSMEEVIARMKAAEELDNKENYQKGRKTGETWLRKHARPKEIRSLAKACNRETPERNPECLLGEWASSWNKGIAGGLLDLIEPTKEHDEREVDVFWEGALGDNNREGIDDFEFAHGFVDAALELWEKIESELTRPKKTRDQRETELRQLVQTNKGTIRIREVYQQVVGKPPSPISVNSNLIEAILDCEYP